MRVFHNCAACIILEKFSMCALCIKDARLLYTVSFIIYYPYLSIYLYTDSSGLLEMIDRSVPFSLSFFFLSFAFTYPNNMYLSWRSLKLRLSIDRKNLYAQAWKHTHGSSLHVGYFRVFFYLITLRGPHQGRKERFRSESCSAAVLLYDYLHYVAVLFQCSFYDHAFPPSSCIRKERLKKSKNMEMKQTNHSARTLLSIVMMNFGCCKKEEPSFHLYIYL